MLLEDSYVYAGLSGEIDDPGRRDNIDDTSNTVGESDFHAAVIADRVISSGTGNGGLACFQDRPEVSLAVTVSANQLLFLHPMPIPFSWLNASKTSGFFPRRGGGLDIFVVDYDRVIAETTAAVLKLNGYAATPFTDERKALAAVSQGSRPRLLITDLILSHFSGPELAIQIHTFCPDLKVIAMTATIHIPEIVHRLSDAGIEFVFCFKPVPPEKLLLAVREFMA